MSAARQSALSEKQEDGMAKTKEAANTAVDPYQNVRATVNREDDEVQIDLMELIYRLIE